MSPAAEPSVPVSGFTVRPLRPAQVVPLRNAVLRPGQPPTACRWANDLEPETIHLGAYAGRTLAAVGTFLQLGDPAVAQVCGVPEPQQRKLRGMAVDSQFQGRGAGSALLAAAYSVLREGGARCIWCSARMTALGFYEKQGWVTLGEVYPTDHGPHIVMWRLL
jgi:L-Ala-D/L-Glu epimerase